MADQYQSISEGQYSQVDTDSAEVDQYTIGSTYFFAPRNTLGPLDQFEYINKASNLFGAYSRAEVDYKNYYWFDEPSGTTDTSVVGGEYFASNNVVIGAAIQDAGETEVYHASVGYLFSPNFLLTLESATPQNEDTGFSIDARYNHQLNGTDYIGFDFSVDDNLDTRTLSSKYFKDLGGETYLVARASYVSDDDRNDDFWSIGGDYYFSKMTSIGFDYDESERYTFGLSHFFTRNIAAKLAYSSTNDDYDLDQYQIGVTVQL